LFRENGVTDGGPVGPSTWSVLVEQYGLEFTSDDPDVDPIGPIDYAVGAIDDPAVTFDDQHLDFATLDAAVPMSDGSTANLHMRWTPTSARQVYGNDGPFLAGNGLARHFNDGCVTANTNAHQKVRFGVAAGTLNGTPFRSYGDFPFAGWIQTAQFLTLHQPLTPETRGSVGVDAFARMQDGVRLVNAARGELIRSGVRRP